MSIAPPPVFYTWGFPGAPIQIRLDLDVVGRIRQQIQASAKGSGLLSGYGILRGDTRKPGITGVLDFEPLPALDAASLEAAADFAFEEAVGFYLTIPMGSLSMPDECRALAERFFHQSSAAFLLIETGDSTIGDAHFGFWGDGGLFDYPVMLFPFDSQELAIKEWQRRPVPVREPGEISHAGPAPVIPATEERGVAAPELESGTASAHAETKPGSVSEHLAVPPADPAPGSIALAPANQRYKSGKRRLAKAVAAVVAASLLAGAVLYSRRRSNHAAWQAAMASEEVKSSLGLSIEKLGNNLLVSWNRNAPVIAKAGFGMLIIRSRELSRDVPLTAEELRSGRVVCAAPMSEARFQLNVLADDQVARESLTVVPLQILDNRGSPPSSGTGNSPSVFSVPVPIPKLRQFKPLESENASAVPPPIGDPPPGLSTAPLNSEALAILNPPSLPSPVAPDLPARSIPQSEPSAPQPEAHPPVAKHQVLPDVPAHLRGMLSSPTAVDVIVSVDELGSVVKAEATAKPGLNPLLREVAVQAARRWRFQPAQLNGHPVAANLVLRFNFAVNP